MPLDLPLTAYVATYCAALVVAGVVCAVRRHDVEFLHAPYWRFLLRPWKVVTFVVASAGLVVVAAKHIDRFCRSQSLACGTRRM